MFTSRFGHRSCLLGMRCVHQVASIVFLKKALSAILVSALICWFGYAAKADTIIPNAYFWGSTASVTDNSRPFVNTINGGGLSAGQNDTNSSQMWLSNFNPPAPPVSIEWALPRVMDLSDIHVWNYNESGGEQNHGLKTVAVGVASTLGGAFSNVATFEFPVAPGTSGYTGFTLSSLTAKSGTWSTQTNVAKIQFTVSDTHKVLGNNRLGLSEVQFITPNTLATTPTALPSHITTVEVKDFSSEDSGNGRLAVDAINGSGISGATHDTNPANMWLTGTPGGNPYITFDLSGNSTQSAQSLGRIQIWGYAEQDNREEAMHIRLLVSPDDQVSNLVDLGDFQAFGRNTASLNSPNPIVSYDLDFSSLTPTQMALLNNVELVRFSIYSNLRSEEDFANSGGTIGNTGFSEIRFFNQEEAPAVPEPSTLALGLIGLAGLGLLAWRRKRGS